VISDTSGLFPHQIPAASTLLEAVRHFGAGLDASETGTGKTYVAMAVARELNVAPVVVCPKAVISSWHRVAEHMGGQCHAINYEKLRTGNTDYGKWVDIREGVKRFEFNPEIPLIIFDEAHRCKAMTSQNAKMMIAAGRQGIPCIAASATVAENPLHMRALGYILRLHDGKAFYKFIRMHGCRQAPFGGFMFVGGKPALQKLHKSIFPERGVRVTREQLGSAFPESQITAELYDLPKAAELDALYLSMREPLERLHSRMASDADLEHPLTQLLRARQKVELLKVPLFAELVEDAIEDGMRPVVFLNFNETIDALLQKFSDSKISVIRGGQTQAERDDAIDRFQSNESEICFANGQAGGVGVSLHDLHGGHPRIAFISPTYSSMQLIQTLGRVWRAGAKSKSLQRLVLASGTVEEKIQKKLLHKLDNLSLINDNDLNPLFNE
jgi:hypothetical protein